MPSSFTAKWCATIDDIQPEDWEKIYGSDIIKSRAFMKANELGEFDDVEFHYLQVFKGNDIIAIVPCFCYDMDLIHIASAGKAKKWIGNIRKVFPSQPYFPTNLLKFKKQVHLAIRRLRF